MTACPSISTGQALAWRMQRHLLEPVGTLPVADVVRRLGAVLAMDGDLAELAIRSRRTGSRSGELAASVRDGTTITMFAFRGAVHHLSPVDGGIYLALRCASRQWELPSWVEHYRLTADEWPDFRAAVREAVSGGPLTVAELGEIVTSQRAYAHLRPVFDDGAITLVKPLTWQGDVSIAPPRDGRLTLQRLDQNPSWTGIPELDDAGPRAITAYLRTYGPATIEQLHYWLGEGLSAGRRRINGWVASLQDRLLEVSVDGAPAYVMADDLDELRRARPSEAVHLLPGHDQWVMGPGTKDERVVPPQLRSAVTGKANLVLVGGVVRGTWRRSGDDVTVTAGSDLALPAGRVAEAVGRLGEILDRELRLTVR